MRANYGYNVCRTSFADLCPLAVHPRVRSEIQRVSGYPVPEGEILVSGNDRSIVCSSFSAPITGISANRLVLDSIEDPSVESTSTYTLLQFDEIKDSGISEDTFRRAWFLNKQSRERSSISKPTQLYMIKFPL